MKFNEQVTQIYSNGMVEAVIQQCTGILPGDFEQIFIEVRRELKRQQKDLILLIEDITAFTGIDQGLLNALVVSHTGENADRQMCKLVSLVGTTSEYYEKFRSNYRDRVTQYIKN